MGSDSSCACGSAPLIGASALLAAATGARGAPRRPRRRPRPPGGASAITYQSATLTGSVKPGDESTVVYFQYGTTTGYGAQSAPTQIPAGTAAVPIAVPDLGPDGRHRLSLPARRDQRQRHLARR